MTAARWGFGHTRDPYLPPTQHVCGYYEIRILAGADVARDIESKADRAQRKLTIAWRRVPRGPHVAPALDSFAGWLGRQRR